MTSEQITEWCMTSLVTVGTLAVITFLVLLLVHLYRMLQTYKKMKELIAAVDPGYIQDIVRETIEESLTPERLNLQIPEKAVKMIGPTPIDEEGNPLEGIGSELTDEGTVVSFKTAKGEIIKIVCS